MDHEDIVADCSEPQMKEPQMKVPEGLCRLQVVADFNPHDGSVVSCMYSYDGEGWVDVTSDNEDLRKSVSSTVQYMVQERDTIDWLTHSEASRHHAPGQDCHCRVCLNCRHRHRHAPQPLQVCACVLPKVCDCQHCLDAGNDNKM